MTYGMGGYRGIGVIAFAVHHFDRRGSLLSAEADEKSGARSGAMQGDKMKADCLGCIPSINWTVEHFL